MEPESGNIDGQVVEKRVHSVQWRVNVSHVLLAAGVVLVGYQLWKMGVFSALASAASSSASESEDDGDRDSVAVEIAEEGLAG